MRRIAVVLGTLLLVPAALAGTGTWTDPSGDAPGAPDITRVTATTAGGTLTFTVLTSAAADWQGAVAFILLDTAPGGDANGTDDQLTLHSLHDLITHEHWNGHGWEIVQPTRASFSLEGSTLTMSVPLAEIGSPQAIAFTVETRGTTGGDNAPDAGTWRVSAATAPSFVPAQPVHGRTFAVTGATTCTATIRGKRLHGNCRWTIPASARGVTLTVVVDGRTHSFRVR